MGDWGRAPTNPTRDSSEKLLMYILSTSLFWAVSFTNKQFWLRNFFSRMCGGPLKCGGPCSAEHVRTLVNPALTTALLLVAQWFSFLLILRCALWAINFRYVLFLRFCIYKQVVNILARNMLNKFLSVFRGLFTCLQLAFIKLYSEYIFFFKSPL